MRQQLSSSLPHRTRTVSFGFIQTISRLEVWFIVPRAFKLAYKAFLAKHLQRLKFCNSSHEEMDQIFDTRNVFQAFNW